MNKLYMRGITGQLWYNFTEGLVYALTYRNAPDCVTYHKHIKYGSDKQQYINIYQHNDNKKRPLLIYIHGGSWMSGITEMRNAYIAEWAKKGFNTAAISYTYSPQKVFPSQLKEVFDAIDFIYDNAEKYNFDMENIVLAGESAGGYFISYVASVIGDKTTLNKLNLTFRHINDFKIKAFVSLSGCFDLKRMSDSTKPQSDFPDIKTMVKSYLLMEYEDAVKYLNSDNGIYVSPQVNASYPPAFLVWADKDLLRYETFDFAEELRQCGVEHRLYKADGVIGMHAWSIVPLFKKSRKCLVETFDFVLPYLCDYFEIDLNNNWTFIRK